MKKMYQILFTSALPAELKVIKNEIKSLNTKDMQIDFFSSGMGNYNTILELTKKLSEKKYDFVVNIWVCGYTDIEKPDLIQVARSQNLANKKEILYPIVLEFAPLYSIACSEVAVVDPELLWENNFVDMESYGFEKVCESFQVARISLKIPVDNIGEETKNFDIEKAKKYLSENINYAELLEKIKNYLEKLPKKYNPEQYFEFYNFTFSEKIIFEKWYYKFISLFIWEDFEDFFQENKHLEKKKFLETLKNKLASYRI